LAGAAAYVKYCPCLNARQRNVAARALAEVGLDRPCAPSPSAWALAVAAVLVAVGGVRRWRAQRGVGELRGRGGTQALGRLLCEVPAAVAPAAGQRTAYGR